MTAPLVGKHGKILVVGGGGTMGSSTALHLARRGFTDIRVLDKWEAPSNDSAGNDLNKIAGADSIGLFGGTSDIAWDRWTSDPVFSPYAHTTGKLDLALPGSVRSRTLRAKYEKLKKLGRNDIEWLDDERAIRAKAPKLSKDADIKGWQGLWCSNGGWVAARDALDSVARECRKLGVKYTAGPGGTFSSLILGPDGKTTKGVRTVDGTKWEGDLVVLAAGAWSPVLVDLEGQCESKSWIYAHIQLTPEESEELRDIPTLYHSEFGFFFEPRSDNHLLKVCNEFPGYTHYQKARPFPLSHDITLSVPRSHASNPTDTIPTEGLEEIKRMVRKTLPQFQDRELVNLGMCWCTDTPDAQWLLCEHPTYKGFVLATGDSGHTFKMLPVVGEQVADLIEGKMSDDRRELWKWRPGHGDPKGTGRGGPRPKDLSEVKGWKHSPTIRSKL